MGRIMPVATIYWNARTYNHSCDVHGDVCRYGIDHERRKVAYCTVCGARLIIIRDEANK